MENLHSTVILMGDFNSQLGKRTSTESKYLGPYTTGRRNKNGQRLIDFIQEHNLCIMNSFFNKKPHKRWTWISPNGSVKNEIDLIITNKRKLFMDVNVIKQLNFNTDHRMIRGEIHGNQQKPTRKNIRSSKKQVNLPLPDNTLVPLEEALRKIKETASIYEKYDTLEKELRETESRIASMKTNKDKVGEKARELLLERQTLQKQIPRDRKEIADISKKIKESIRKHRQDTRTERIIFHIKTTGGVKKAWKELQESTDWIPKLRDKTSKKDKTKRIDILKVATNFYRDLYSENNKNPPRAPSLIDKHDEEEVPPILDAEIAKAIQSQKSGKSPGEDGISNELLKGSNHVIMETLRDLFNKILDKEELPPQWSTSAIILLHKKGSRDDIANYRPISLMPNLYKIFAKVILDRITKILDENQPKEQAGFRSGFSTVDHIHTIKQVIEKYNEYQMTYYLAFVDYNKAFDSLKHLCIWEALLKQGVHKKYIRIIKAIYTNMTARVKTERVGENFEIKKGVRQGDPLSPKLFSATLEQAFRNLDWDGYGIKINGAIINHLRFADDLILITDNPKHLQEMLEQLVRESTKVGLQLNTSKTKLMTNHIKTPISINNKNIEYVEEYIYLGQIISPTQLTTKEIQNRINSSWKRYWSLKEILKNPSIPLKLKRHTFNACILPVMTYGCQTWPLTNENIKKLATCQHNMERSVLNLKRKDKVKLGLIRKKTNITDVTFTIKKLKWQWAGHTLRSKIEKWAKDVTEWYPREGMRKRGRPVRRWEDDLRSTAGATWRRKTQDRVLWKGLGEAYASEQDK